MKAVIIAVGLSLAAVADGAEQWKVVLTFQGNGPKTSPAFVVRDGWRARWSAKQVKGVVPDWLMFQCTAEPVRKAGKYEIIGSADKAHADMSYGRVGGTYQIEVSSMQCVWQVIVEEPVSAPRTAQHDPSYVPAGVDPFSLRLWTRGDGAKVAAYYISATEVHVKIFVPAHGREFEFPIYRLSQEDREYVAMRKSDPFAGGDLSAGGDPFAVRDQPK